MRLSVLGAEALLCYTLVIVGVYGHAPAISMACLDHGHSSNVAEYLLVILSLSFAIPLHIEWLRLTKVSALFIPGTFMPQHRKYSSNHEELLSIRPPIVPLVQLLTVSSVPSNIKVCGVQDGYIASLRIGITLQI